MKKLFVTLFAFVLVACSSGVTLNQASRDMPKGQVAIGLEVVSTSSLVSDGILLAAVKVSGSAVTKQLVELVAVDNMAVGIFGKSQALNKVTVIYALEHAEKIGQNVHLYMAGSSETDKAELEKSASQKNIALHYSLI
ncbi:hypothetical protein [Otariodibacter oris]|uniref:Lipoprotein n=1 Tax=Otariodibacter oris TaxID=1032623 RepID=A0A420XFR7_9PAST|nr:hypothetical protein [Otariodibacter oris]QGM80309.1 hypothetical protein A6A10_02305 [Otariodibacter oris]RKR71677.1 hypothetical protein DES31_1412 [Otariodibacter oris]